MTYAELVKRLLSWNNEWQFYSDERGIALNDMREAANVITALEADKWQDIATAPKDGTVVLLFQEGRIATGIWIDTSHEVQEEVARDGNRVTFEWVKQVSGYWDTSDDIYVPTHWQPLPSPPALTEVKGD